MGYLEENEQIIKELLEGQKIKIGGLINYVYFSELYQPYRKKLNEVEFAEVLGISRDSYFYIKNQKGRTKVLKEKIEKATEETKKEIIQELIRNKKIEPGQLIDYKKFQELFEIYKEKINENEFAELLGISYENYNSLKNAGKKAKVLKDKVVKVTDNEKQKIIDDLIKSCKIEIGKLIDYKEFKDIYEPYKKIITEDKFAGLLGISYENYKSIKNKGTKAKVLKDKAARLTDKEKQKIIDDLIKSCKIEIGKFIEYKEFKEIYKPYKEIITEKDFANLLGINSQNFRIIKKNGTKTAILKEKTRTKSEEVKEKIVEELIRNKKLKPGQSVNYTEFQELYKKYKEKIDEKEFAEVLGISRDSYFYIKNQKGRAKVLKEKIEKASEETKKEIIQELIRNKKIEPGQLIDYKKFQELFEIYKEKANENEFAELLGITYSNYTSLKYTRNKSKSIKR